MGPSKQSNWYKLNYFIESFIRNSFSVPFLASVRDEKISWWINDKFSTNWPDHYRILADFHCDGVWKWFKINYKGMAILTDGHIYINKFVTLIWSLCWLRNLFFPCFIIIIIIVPVFYCTWANTFESSLIVEHRWSAWIFEFLTLIRNCFRTFLFPKPF